MASEEDRHEENDHQAAPRRRIRSLSALPASPTCMMWTSTTIRLSVWATGWSCETREAPTARPPSRPSSLDRSDTATGCRSSRRRCAVAITGDEVAHPVEHHAGGRQGPSCRTIAGSNGGTMVCAMRGALAAAQSRGDGVLQAQRERRQQPPSCIRHACGVGVEARELVRG